MPAVEAVRRHPNRVCIRGHFDRQSPDRRARPEAPRGGVTPGAA